MIRRLFSDRCLATACCSTISNLMEVMASKVRFLPTKVLLMLDAFAITKCVVANFIEHTTTIIISPLMY